MEDNSKMDRETLLTLVARARARAEHGDADIEAQHEIVTKLECKGVDATRARDILAKLISSQETDIAEMERLLDELEQG
jgi:hypothetical protein